MTKYLDDALVIIGCVLIIIGTYQINPLATWFVAGAMLIIGGVLVGIGRSHE